MSLGYINGNLSEVPSAFGGETVNVGGVVYGWSDALGRYVPQKSTTPANRYAYCYAPCNDPSAGFFDQSGRCGHLYPTPGNTGAFANAGYASTIAGTATGVVLGSPDLRWNPATDWLILSFVLNKATPAASETLVSIGSTFPAGTQGFYVSHRTNGKLRVVPLLNAAADSRPVDSNLVFTSATAAPVTVTVAYDPIVGSYYLYKDGQLSDYYPQARMVGANAYPNGVVSFPLTFGGYGRSTDATIAMQFANVHVYSGTGALPLSIGRIAKLIASRNAIVPEEEFIFAKKRVVLGIGAGQSNEVGPGPVAWVSRVNGDGAPSRDGTFNQGGNGSGGNSIHPMLSSLAARRGTWLEVRNTGYGSTSATGHWCGYCRTWTSTMAICSGSYVISVADGKLYKATLAAIGTAPVFNPADPGVGPTAGITWTDLGAPGPRDTHNRVYESSDVGRFDPNGLVAAAIAAASPTANPSFDTYAMLLSIGQGDKTLSVQAAQYSEALQNLAKYYMSLGYIAVVGLTIRGNTTGLNAWFTSDLVPGWSDACSKLAGYPLFRQGANAADALGLLPTEATPNSVTASLQADALHANPRAMADYAAVVDAALSAGGL